MSWPLVLSVVAAGCSLAILVVYGRELASGRETVASCWREAATIFVVTGVVSVAAIRALEWWLACPCDYCRQQGKR